MNLVVPEHIPAFTRRKQLEEVEVDPRVCVIIGDSEAALSAIDGLRATFTGKIYLVPTSDKGQFENRDVLLRKFSPLS